MRAVIQRVSRAKVSVGGETAGAIGAGLLVLLGVSKDDGEADAAHLADKTAGLRIFEDETGVSGRPIWNAWPRDLKMRPGFSNSSRPRACHPIPVNPT